LALALRAADAGHEVRMFRFSKKPTRYAEGFPQIALIDDWKASMPWAREGLILNMANNRYLWELDRYRQDFGYTNIFAPTVASARLEIDRKAGMDLIEAIGLDLPEYHTFNSLEEAEAFARKSSDTFVFKPAGDCDDKSLTYVSHDPADMVGWLRRQIKAGKKLGGKAMLQKKIDRLAEIGVSGWMGPEGFLPERYQVCHEHKPLYPGDIGQATGEQGTVTSYTDDDKLAREMLLPLEPTLRTLGHRGDFAVGAMVDTKGKAWFLEFTARFGYPCHWIQTASHKGDPIQWMADLLKGKDSLKVSYDVAIGVVLSQPMYPFDAAPPGMVEGIPIRGVDEVGDQFYPVEVMRGKGPVWQDGKIVEQPTWETAGEYVAVVCGLGKTVQRAQAKVYGAIDKIKFPNVGYRNDIGDRLEHELPKLHQFGYALNINW
jgi:phosphoribosylamine--glycine ligase